MSEFDESRFEQHLDEGEIRLALAACWYWIRKLQARFFAGDYAAAIEAASKARRASLDVALHFEVAEYHFYAALARAAACNSASADERAQHFSRRWLAHHKQLAVWAKNCPENFANRAALVAAEIARLEGRELDAMRLYEEAIRSAREHGFVQNEGLANELAARFYAARGLETICRRHICARPGTATCRWGADGKVRQLEHATRTCARSAAAPRPSAADRHAPRTAGPRDGRQGLAGDLGRDRPREVD